VTRSAVFPEAPPAPLPVKESEWSPRMWHGCDFFAWIKLLARNRFRVHWSCLYIAVVATFITFGNTLIGWLQEAILGRRIRKTKIAQPPIFILGHWRTGTTLLHELLVLNPRFGYPSTYECLQPTHFLLTESLVTRYLQFLVPAHRPMDNMKAGFDRPQEDEFALCMMGQPSPYLSIAFPNNPPQCQKFLDLEGVDPGALRSWKRTLKRFLKQVTYKSGKRLVLKSPPHTARIKVLREMFPGALFIHIIRDPYVVFPSTVKLWKTLYRAQGLQKPTNSGLEEHVLATFTRLYQRLEEGKRLLGPEQFYELRYEDLTKDPTGEMRKLYDHFRLPGFGEFLPRLQSYLASVNGYETNKYQVTPEQRAVIAQRWGEVIARYGY
jgi:hypothetical protein